jgi:hypothetical protein
MGSPGPVSAEVGLVDRKATRPNLFPHKALRARARAREGLLIRLALQLCGSALSELHPRGGLKMLKGDQISGFCSCLAL